MDAKVLMIDDDEVIAQSTAEYFNMFDVKTEYVTSFDAAVEFLDKNMVSLLLLDINLGDKSGFELCKKVREKYDMPILFISARTSDDDVLIALNIGGDDYIKKPFTLNVLLAKVKAILARYEKSKEAALLLKQSADSPDTATAALNQSTQNPVIRLTKIISMETVSVSCRQLRKGCDEGRAVKKCLG